MKNYSAIILSAGYSSRMGSFKPLLNLGEKTPLQSSIDLFHNCGINDIIVVTGHSHDLIEKQLEDDIKTVHNTRYSDGMLSSIKAGVGLLSKGTDAFFILPVDIPSIKSHTINKMIERYEKTVCDNCILYPMFNGEKGHPPLVTYSLAREILESNPRGGLIEIFNKHKNQWYYEKVADRGILLDMDTKEQFNLLLEHISVNPYPDFIECIEILRLCNVNTEAIEHMICVADFAKKIALQMNKKGYDLNTNAVYSGALLHDVAKGKKNHAEEGAKIIEGFGYNFISEIIREHMELNPDLNLDLKISEKKLVYLCDKLIKGTKFVTLDGRFEEPFNRYRYIPEILRNVNKRYMNAIILKENIEKVLGCSLEKVM